MRRKRLTHHCGMVDRTKDKSLDGEFAARRVASTYHSTYLDVLHTYVCTYLLAAESSRCIEPRCQSGCIQASSGLTAWSRPKAWRNPWSNDMLCGSIRPFLPRRGYGGNFIFTMCLASFSSCSRYPRSCVTRYMIVSALAWGVASVARRLLHMRHFRHWIPHHTA